MRWFWLVERAEKGFIFTNFLNSSKKEFRSQPITRFYSGMNRKFSWQYLNFLGMHFEKCWSHQRCVWIQGGKKGVLRI